MKVIINICHFGEIDGVTFASTIKDDVKAAVSHIEDLEYQIVDTGNNCEINFIFHGDVEPVEEAANKFIDQIDMRDFLVDIEIYDLGEED